MDGFFDRPTPPLCRCIADKKQYFN
jgi:hypothetical protein